MDALIFTDAPSSSATLALLLVILPILGALFGAAIGRWADASEKRRERYADAVRVLVRWAEFPYRVRRRTSDDAEELKRLAELGHDLQEQLACHQTWVQAESVRVGSLFAEMVDRIKARTGSATSEAWRCQPVRSGSEMVLHGWGPQIPDETLTTLNEAIGRRFGWRRMIPSDKLARAMKRRNQ